MTLVVGYGPETRGSGGLALAGMLARTAGEPLVVCCVVPDRWRTPSAGKVDAEYAAHLRHLADEALERAREQLGGELSPELVVRTGQSVPQELLAEVADRGARMLVVGSSSDGLWGHIGLGSVTDRLLHSSPVPLAIAPRGHFAAPGERVDRVTVALDGTPASTSVLVAAARATATSSARLRVVAFAVRGRTMFPPEAGLHAEDAVVAAWREQAQDALQRCVGALHELDDVAAPEEVGIIDGRDWADALERVRWLPGDVLVIGSSGHSPVRRVFLGSTATHIVRHSPVPVIALPATG